MTTVNAGANPAPDVDGDAASSPFELFILALSVMSLANFVVLLLPISTTSKGVLVAVDTFMCIFFLVDFGHRLRRADSKADYFLRRYGWLDLLGSLPFLRILRIARVVRVVKTFHARGSEAIWQGIERKRAETTLLFVTLLVIVTVEVGSIAMLWAERDQSGANIKNASDALWWCLVTITTIGYGDLFPVSNVGRVIGSFVMIVGVGLFGTFTAFVANAFVNPRRRLRPPPPQTTLAEMRTLLQQQQDLVDQLRVRVGSLERPSRRTGS